jgi:Fe-Mn family superoxide dismutase
MALHQRRIIMAVEFKPRPLPFSYDALRGISEQTNKYHHDTHYGGYVNKRNEIEKGLESVDRSLANANYSEFAALKRHETFNANGQILHEIYWEILGGRGRPEGMIVERLKRDFGSFEKWREDFIACAKIALGWAILCWDHSDGRLRNFTGDTHNQGGVWGAIPLIPIDCFEHAYYHDHGPNRAAYINAFLENIDWTKVDARYQKHVPRTEQVHEQAHTR